MRKMVKPHKVRKTPPSIGIAWYYDGKDDIKQKHQNAKQWMFNWLSNRLPQLERNADATSYRYQLYTPKIKSGDVRERGWNVDYYNNYYNPLAYLKNSTPQRNRLMKLVHSQVNNATNTPYQSVGPQVVGGIGNVKGVYVKPNHFNNSGNYIAYDGIPENDVVVHEMTHASHPNPQRGYITDAIFDGNVPDVGAGGKNNRDRADEIYG